jgi:hypothetical protein
MVKMARDMDVLPKLTRVEQQGARTISSEAIKPVLYGLPLVRLGVPP